MALLVYLSWLLQEVPKFKSLSVPHVPWQRFTYVDHYRSPTRTFRCTGELVHMSEGLGGPLHPPICMLHYSTYLRCQGVLASICTLVTDVTTGSFWLYWFILHAAVVLATAAATTAIVAATAVLPLPLLLPLPSSLLTLSSLLPPLLSSLLPSPSPLPLRPV